MHTSTWHFWKVSRYWCSFVRTLRLKRFLLRNWGCCRGSWKSMKKPCWAVLRSWTCCNRNWLPPNRETRYCLRSFWLGLGVFISTLVCQAVGIKSCYKSSENWCHLFILPAHSLCLTSGDIQWWAKQMPFLPSWSFTFYIFYCCSFPLWF